MENTLNKQIEQNQDELIKSIIQIVQIPSVKSKPEIDAPYGADIKTALVETLKIAEKLGFRTQIIEDRIGYAQYGEGEEYIGVLGHLDVVPTGEGWQDSPFSGVIKNGKIYGRGVLDNKGPIISALYGLYAIKEAKLKLNTPIRIIFGTDEESGFGDIPYYLKHEKPPIMGFTPDCKYPVVYGERGRANIQIEINHGKENYAERAKEFFEFINEYVLSSNTDGNKLGINYSDQEYGMMEMRNYQLQSDINKLIFKITLSYPANTSIEKIIKQIKSKLTSNLEIKLTLNYNPVKFDKHSKLVSNLQNAYEEVTGLDGTPVTTTGGTYAKIMPNIVPFGPSFPGQKGISHNPNEYMDISDIILNAKIFAQAIYKLAK